MAIYQFNIELIPKKWVHKNPDVDVNKLFDSGIYDTILTWKNYSLLIDLSSEISKILLPSKSWHKDLAVWGDDEYSDIQVWSNNNKIESILIRLDLREDIEFLKRNIIELANVLSCYFFLPAERKIIKPDIEELNQAISHSKAMSFINNPTSFLDKIRKNVDH